MLVPKALLLSGLTLLAACAPAAAPPAPRLESGVVNREVGFYPASDGLRWVYLPEEERVDAPRYEVRVVGPTVFEGKTLLGVSFTGRGQDRLYYREVSAGGVRLHGEAAAGSFTAVYDPPVLEYPAEGNLRVGATWSSEGKVTVRAQGAAPRTVDYRVAYRVLSEQDYRVGNTTYKTLLINRDWRLSSGEAENQTIRFVPRVGEVYRGDRLVLVERNF